MVSRGTRDDVGNHSGYTRDEISQNQQGYSDYVSEINSRNEAGEGKKQDDYGAALAQAKSDYTAKYGDGGEIGKLTANGSIFTIATW